MAWRPTLLEDSLDLATEPDSARRRAVIEFLIQLCDGGGHADGAVVIPGTQLPAYAATVPGHHVVIVWVIAEKYEELAIRYLFDVDRSQYFGG